MTFNEYLQGVFDPKRREGHQRLGQWAFNVLASVRPDLADKVRGTDVDPFCDDEILALFMEFVQERWEDV